ncbi:MULTISPECIES: helix-turn-helix domain-containing protein [Bacillaceae]|uniref:Helix-turn-helix transcriptional regulator n=1 Tax=Evansella alkalicola TaxID=745819 RepID=A0ABS6JZT4_9BACI|nr:MULTISPECIES: helix-turn-helix domain-containing protein [Bacillaceae]MBU9724112.1 helix-turn-helix transcriptional regulator [Bacillus alkalicola]
MFKNKIDYWIKEKGLVGKFVIKKMNISEATFISWKKNNTQPNLEQAYRLSKIFQISVDDLCEEIDEEH